MKWCRGKLIGHGASAAVYLAESLPNGDVFVAKSVECSRSNALRREQEIHSKLKCDRIIEYKGFDVTIENGMSFYNIFLEYAFSGTLIDAIRKKGGGLSDSLVRRYSREILQGLEYIHSKGIVHCDVKGANILVTSEGVKIGDFGSCKRVDDVVNFDSFGCEIRGTPIYMAPEVARGEQQSYTADVWAFGCTVFEMATGLSPWPNIAQDPLLALYHIGFSDVSPQIPNFLSDQAKDFLAKCLKRDPKERSIISDLLKHPFVSDNGPTHEPTFDTPTSILDLQIWSKTLEEPYSAQTQVAQERSIKCPIERIKEMVNSYLDEFPNWAWNDDWITVRSNRTKEKPRSISSHMGLSTTQNIQPNMTTGNLNLTVAVVLCKTIEMNFPFLTVSFLNCCKITIYSKSCSKAKVDVITKIDFITKCIIAKYCFIKIVEYYFLPIMFY
ncbi:unnamed protein product, partial [Amaranthus hypochondriacus]